MSADWRATLRAMIPVLEAGVWDEQQMVNLIDALDNRPDTILPHCIGLSSYVAFLCTKIDRADLASRILYATLTWELANNRATDDIALSIKNIEQVEELLGHPRSPDLIRRTALDRSYIPTPPDKNSLH